MGLWRQWCFKTIMLIYKIQFKLQKMWPTGSFPGEKLTPIQRDKIQLNTLTVSKKCEKLLNAIEHGITADPGVFYKFVEILCEEPTTEKLGNQFLCDVRSKLAS